MIQGYARTAVELEDFDLKAMYFDGLLEPRKKLELRSLSSETILDDLEHEPCSNDPILAGAR